MKYIKILNLEIILLQSINNLVQECSFYIVIILGNNGNPLLDRLKSIELESRGLQEINLAAEILQLELLSLLADEDVVTRFSLSSGQLTAPGHSHLLYLLLQQPLHC